MNPGDPLIGRQLGDYTIQSLLGRGGMSRVYKGYDANLDRYAAVKVISGDFATTTEEEYSRRFQTEARAIARLRHPNIVGIYQFGRTEGIYYMAQVFLEGKDLRTLLREYADRHQRMPHADVLRIMRDITSALDYAHELGVIHRDIKPSNIMLERKTGRAILMDFGLALSVHEGTLGDTFGSAHYIAPEQAISSAKAVPQSDLYALGIVLYEMLTGTVPFDDPSVMSVALKHLNELPPPPSLHNPNITPEIETVILRALDKDPAHRYRSGRAFAEALQRALAIGLPAEAEAAEAAQIPAVDLWTPRQTPVVTSDAGAETPTPALRRPTPPEPSVRTESEAGLAGRFRRRKEQKEAAAALESSDGLKIDDNALSRLLQDYADPRDLGLVGEGAPGVTPPPRHVDGRISKSRRSRPAQARRRSRVIPLVLLIALLAGVAVVAWLVLRGDDSGDGSLQGAGGAPPPTLDALAVAAAQTSTAAAGEIVTARPTSAPPATLVQVTVTRAPSATLSAQPPEITATQQVLVQPALTATPEPTLPPASPSPASATATSAPSATLTPPPTDEPTATATSAPSATLAPTTEVPDASPTGTPTAAPTEPPAPPATATQAAVAVPEATATVTAAPSATSPPAPTGARAPNVRLTYVTESEGQGQLRLTNLGNAALDISGLVFERRRPDGGLLSFQASLWERPDITGSPSAMPGRSCFELVTTNGTTENRLDDDCMRYLGFYRTNVTTRYFWISAEPGASFAVRDAVLGLELATCAIDAGRCEFYAGADAGTAPPPASPTPGGVPEEQGALRLIYDANGFLIVNITDRVLDISGLVFEQQAGGLTRRFAAREWEREDIEVPPSEMPPGGCYQLVPAEGTQTIPADDVCPRLLGWFRTGVTSRYFWLSSVPEAIFAVRQANAPDPLATCPVGEATCNIPLPAQE